MPVGYWCPVLHAHLPYVRHPEYPQFLEEDWLFEAITETYVPLIRVLDGLERDGVGFRLTMTLSPPLLSKLTDGLLVERYHRYVDRLVRLYEKEDDRTAREAGIGAALRDQSPEGEASLRLRIAGASFDTLITWLASLQQQHDVVIEMATIGPAGPGMVNAMLSLKQAGAG